MTDQKIKIVEHVPCEKWEEYSDTGYCKHCGGQQIVHPPHLDRVFDMMDRLLSTRGEE